MGIIEDQKLALEMETALLSTKFIGITEDQANEYIDSKVIDPGARIVFKKVAKNLIILNEIMRVRFGDGSTEPPPPEAP